MTDSWIRTVRANLGITQHDLARLLGVSPYTVSRWENGDLSSPLQHAILVAFERASKNDPRVGRRMIVIECQNGLVEALTYAFEVAGYGGLK
jgi:transcriptional regulator with XRE-family HTH domain